MEVEKMDGGMAFPAIGFLLLFGFVQLLAGTMIIGRHALQKKVIHGVLAILIPPYGIYWAMLPYRKDEGVQMRILNIWLYFCGWIVTAFSAIALLELLIIVDKGTF
jgi:hypothetical protein